MAATWELDNTAANAGVRGVKLLGIAPGGGGRVHIHMSVAGPLLLPGADPANPNGSGWAQAYVANAGTDGAIATSLGTWKAGDPSYSCVCAPGANQEIWVQVGPASIVRIEIEI